LWQVPARRGVTRRVGALTRSSALINWSRRAQPFAFWHVPTRRLHDGGSGHVRPARLLFPIPPISHLARPAGRLGKQIARLACGPGGLSQWDASGSELGRQVAVDFESDADFHECGSCPVHSRLPISSQRCSITRPSSRSTVVVTVRRNVVSRCGAMNPCCFARMVSVMTGRPAGRGKPRPVAGSGGSGRLTHINPKELNGAVHA
jgi:hypothetical protein